MILTTKIIAKGAKNGVKNEVSLTDDFIAWPVYTINMYSNMKNYKSIYNCLRVIQQNKNRK